MTQNLSDAALHHIDGDIFLVIVLRVFLPAAEIRGHRFLWNFGGRPLFVGEGAFFTLGERGGKGLDGCLAARSRYNDKVGYQFDLFERVALHR